MNEYFFRLSGFDAFIGKEIAAISTSHGQLYQDSLRGNKIDLTLHMRERHLSLFCKNFKTDFIENDSGDAFYDFKIKTNAENLKIDCQKELNLGVVDHIKIYHRELKINEEHKKLPWVQKTFGSSEHVEDLFLFNFENKRKLLVTFHPFFTGIEAFFTYNSISEFFDEYGDIYKLSQEIR